jgi:tRNA modification GTPase
LRLTDTAGLRDISPCCKEKSEAECIGITRTLELLDKADLVLYVIDGVEGITAEDREFWRKENLKGKPILLLWNKADLVLPPPLDKEDLPGKLLPLSAKTGEGISALTHFLTSLLENGRTSSLERTRAAGSPPHNTVWEETAGPGTLRQKELIDTALASVEEALALTSQDDLHELVPLDVIAPLFRSAVNALGEITGEVSSADIFDAMFSRFCVGK